MNERLKDQLERTSAMLAVMLEDVYDIVPDQVKERICLEIFNINRCLRESNESTN